MNERIKELIAQATTNEKGPPNWGLTANTTIATFDKEKFAELIIRECSNYIGNKAMLAGGACTIVGEEGLWLSKDLLKHFGVKE